MTVELGILLVAIGAILGIGVLWGIIQQTVQSFTRRLEDLEKICEHQRSNCQSILDEFQALQNSSRQETEQEGA